LWVGDKFFQFFLEFQKSSIPLHRRKNGPWGKLIWGADLKDGFHVALNDNLNKLELKF
jgi:hypothetical protein